MIEPTVTQKVKTVIWFENTGSYSVVRRKFRTDFGPDVKCPDFKSVRLMHERFLNTGSIFSSQRPGPRLGELRRVRSAENVQRVLELFRHSPKMSTRRASLQLEIGRTALQRILKAAGLKPYRIQVLQALDADDKDKRVEFAELMLDKMQNDPSFLSLIVFSDEAHFHLNGRVSKQNCRIWALENPQAYQEQPLHSPRTTVWCGIWSGGLIGPFFFGETVNGE